MTDTSTEAIGIAISQKSTLIDKDCSRKDKMIRAQAAERDALKAASEWQPIETAPHGIDVLLYCPDMGCPSNRERIELGTASSGERVGLTSTMSYHSWATHWQPLPQPPEITP